MAVPDTNTFTLQDVVTEVNPTTDDLTDCFADAVAASFDAAYEGSKDRLSNFRNSGAVSLTAFTTNATWQSTKSSVVGFTVSTTSCNSNVVVFGTGGTGIISLVV